LPQPGDGLKQVVAGGREGGREGGKVRMKCGGEEGREGGREGGRDVPKVGPLDVEGLVEQVVFVDFVRASTSPYLVKLCE